MSGDNNRPVDRRCDFVHHLYGLYQALNQDSPARPKARQELARLRRSFAGPRHEAEAYGIVFRFDPPSTEQKAWLLAAGLFALHPQPPNASGRSIGGAMRLLSGPDGDPARDGHRASVRRRFEQLLSVDRQHLPYYLRQAVTLLRAGDITFDFYTLLDDLVVLLNSEFTADAAHAVRLRWARDFFRQPGGQKNPDTSDRTVEPATV